MEHVAIYDTVKYVIHALLLSPRESVTKRPPVPRGAGQRCDRRHKRPVLLGCSQRRRGGGDVRTDSPAGAHGAAARQGLSRSWSCLARGWAPPLQGEASERQGGSAERPFT